MPGNQDSNRPPLSAAEIRTSQLHVPQHSAPDPNGYKPVELPRSTVVPVKTPTAEDQPAVELQPSMPDNQREIRLEPNRFEIGEPPRLVFAAQELEPLLVFNPDGRRVYDDRSFPWVLACHVFSGSKGGSGALIGPRHVLTASHCIDWQQLTVSVSMVQGSTQLATAGATHIMAYEHIVDVTYSNADDDYAVVVLDSRLGDAFGSLGCRTYDAGWDNETANWFNIAYEPLLHATAANFQTGFFLDEDDFDLGGGRMLITKTGDFLKGMSGSPVFGFWPEGPFVVGVASAGANGGVFGNYNAIAGGGNLTRLVSKARADFP
ncbi:trypsin-like serine peptidase [Streptomyces sp. DH10]|uniref:trypsin-like serine peptidase n=1 Tax=Streptomyces sp. DH10 TaxID=3040121 RepID=UPI0024428ECB|nr:trypsin-like serine protease [Streptomyces sp. DH10]MDG9711823.1 trypsin-like serine protease [Streptomyces sp. DH10]